MPIFRSFSQSDEDPLMTIPGLSSGVEVRRSTRRKRTIAAHREGETIIVLIPATLTKREEVAAVREMIERLNKKDLKQKISDADLQKRAEVLSNEFFGGSIQSHSVRWVGNMRERWASCTPEDRSIRISDRVRLMPEYVLDYVLVHELAHLLEVGHTPGFYELEARYPDRERAEAYLDGWQDGSGSSVETF